MHFCGTSVYHQERPHNPEKIFSVKNFSSSNIIPTSRILPLTPEKILAHYSVFAVHGICFTLTHNRTFPRWSPCQKEPKIVPKKCLRFSPAL